ncbi:MAG: 4'-phosphopantetheinyl transferase superfamily protein [Gammaproteobacteria bacterium]|nr:4'-phosphopantetheinyl transferase superfamily protein [Gammaproteobacteria bacterium]
MAPPRSDTLHARVAALFPPGVITCVSLDPAALADLSPREAEATLRFATARLTEFRRGRYCAREALRGLAVPEHEVPVGSNREPLWPDGVVGSISHTRGMAAAVVGRRSEFASLGLDIEDAGALEPSLVARICRDDELAQLDALGLGTGEAALLVFSIKEAAYKALWPVIRHFLNFHDIATVIDTATQQFRVQSHAPYCARSVCDAISGRYWVEEHWLAAGATLAQPSAASKY